MRWLSLIAVAVAPFVEGSAVGKRATVCNGYAELCGKSYGNVTFVGTHNSYAVGGDVADNQGWNITQQLVSRGESKQSQVWRKGEGANVLVGRGDERAKRGMSVRVRGRRLLRRKGEDHHEAKRESFCRVRHTTDGKTVDAGTDD